MIRSIFHKIGARDQRGGIAILTALGFLLFSIPLITSSLNLAQNTAIDSRVKTVITHRQYCGLAVQEYLDYLLLDNTRWANWLTANVDPNDPTGATYTETIDPCGRSLTITVTQQPVLPPGSTDDSLGDPLITIPPLSSYNNRAFQVTKTVSNPNPTGGDSITYTVTVINRDDSSTTLTKFKETLPSGFSYDCDGPNDQLTLPGGDPDDIEPTGGQCPGGSDIEWSLPSNTTLLPGESATLTFTAVTSVVQGTYCNEAQVTPGGDKTRSGKTAIVQIGPTAGLCADNAMVIAQTVTSADLVSTDTNTAPYTYSFNIEFTITVGNIGSDDLTLKEFIDLLPLGFSYHSTSPSGDITESPDTVRVLPQSSREEITWKFDPDIPIASGTTKTLIFSTTASITKGDYWSDLLVDLGGGSFDDIYSWPTALVSVKDVYNVTATDDQGNQVLISAQVWIGDENGVVSTWTLQ